MFFNNLRIGKSEAFRRIARCWIDNFARQIQNDMRVGAASARFTAAFNDLLRTRSGRFKGLGWVLTIGNRLLNCGYVRQRGFRSGGGGERRTVPQAIAPDIDTFPVCQRDRDGAFRARCNLFSGKDSVAFYQ